MAVDVQVVAELDGGCCLEVKSCCFCVVELHFCLSSGGADMRKELLVMGSEGG